MSRQDKATTERFTKTLRELIKRTENKTCADCKRNDPRWASWNIGVFLCIRCSGIHRGMGTHISKVKSVDLDVWTPDQMESIQKWGNYRANLYWEAHLKPGHIPPEHKMESFVRSKYESRRWALDGPPPVDPSVLDNGAAPSAPAPASQQPPTPTSATRPTFASGINVSTRPSAAAPVTSRQPQPHQLLSTGYTNRQSIDARGRAAAPPVAAKAPTPPPPQPKAPENDLFSLDFHAPASASVNNGSASQQPKKDTKQDILSLFSSPTSATLPATSTFGQFGAAPTQASPWGNAQPQQQQQQPYPQQTSMMGNQGAGAWGVSSGWNAPAAPPAQGNLWGAPAAPAQPNLFGNNSDVWGGAAATGSAGADLFSTPFAGGAAVQKKDDVFGDLWGGFK